MASSITRKMLHRHVLIDGERHDFGLLDKCDSLDYWVLPLFRFSIQCDPHICKVPSITRLPWRGYLDVQQVRFFTSTTNIEWVIEAALDTSPY